MSSQATLLLRLLARATGRSELGKARSLPTTATTTTTAAAATTTTTTTAAIATT